MPLEVREVGLEGVVFCYQIGYTHTAIWTKPKGQTRAEIPDYLKVSFGINTPSNFYDPKAMLRDDQIEEIIKRLIAVKVGEQKASGRFFSMKIEEPKEKPKKAKRKGLNHVR